jgi:hypothetical protein
MHSCWFWLINNLISNLNKDTSKGRRSGGRGYEKWHVTDGLNPFLQLNNKFGKSKNERSDVFRCSLKIGK